MGQGEVKKMIYMSKESHFGKKIIKRLSGQLR